MPDRPSVLIVGASIAGPAIAFWLGRAGWDVTVIEKARSLRPGGQAVDFRTRSHFKALGAMGVLPKLEALATGGCAMRFLDSRGRTRALLAEEFAGGELEVQRGDLCRVLVEAGTGRIEYRYGHGLAGLTQHADDVEAHCDNGWTGRFDFVIGADGIHSRTRRLVLGASYETYMGYYLAGWEAPGLSCPPNEASYVNRPGRALGIGPGRPGTPPNGRAFFVSPERAEARGSLAEQKRFVLSHLHGLGWRAPELIASLEAAEDLFLSPISQVDPPDWSAGRVALLGDAACGATLGGMGTGTAILGAYILAGELLSSAPGEHTGAFARYQHRLQPMARALSANGGHAGMFHAPRTRRGLWFRNTALSIPAIQRWMIEQATKLGDDIELPDYEGMRAPAEAA